MRFLVATAGLLVLAGAAVSGRPTVHTLRRSTGGPIVAIAQDNSVAAWFTSGAKTKTCNVVHVLSPGKRDQSMPQPASGSLTCNWTLANWPTQLAIASRLPMALWTLHESGPSPADRVMAATFGGPERQLKRLAHASDGTGDWLGGIAGAGHTLVYSWDDVEYVNPSRCLSGQPCKQKIADGGIRVVTRTTDTPLPTAQPALQLAVAAGRIAYIPATIVHGGRPSTTTNATLPIMDVMTGEVLGQPKVHGIPLAIALSPHVLAVLTTLAGPHDRISWYSALDGSKLGSVLVAAGASPQLAASDQLIVYRVGRVLHDVSTRTGRVGRLMQTGKTTVGLSLSRGRLIWAQNHNGVGRLRALSLG